MNDIATGSGNPVMKFKTRIAMSFASLPSMRFKFAMVAMKFIIHHSSFIIFCAPFLC